MAKNLPVKNTFIDLDIGIALRNWVCSAGRLPIWNACKMRIQYREKSANRTVQHFDRWKVIWFEDSVAKLGTFLATGVGGFKFSVKMT